MCDRSICRSFIHPAVLAAIRRSGRNKSGGGVGGLKTTASENMEIAKALWQLFYAMLIFACYLLFIIFVAPFGFGFATIVSALSSFRGRSYLSATIAVFTGILLEALAFWIWIVSWIFGNPAHYRWRPWGLPASRYAGSRQRVGGGERPRIALTPG
jgi:hypothetical protein